MREFEEEFGLSIDVYRIFEEEVFEEEEFEF